MSNGVIENIKTTIESILREKSYEVATAAVSPIHYFLTLELKSKRIYDFKINITLNNKKAQIRENLISRILEQTPTCLNELIVVDVYLQQKKSTEIISLNFTLTK
jgi:hypothetical protein